MNEPTATRVIRKDRVTGEQLVLVSTHIPHSIAKQVSYICAKRHRSVSSLFRMMAEDFVRQNHDALDWLK